MAKQCVEQDHCVQQLLLVHVAGDRFLQMPLHLEGDADTKALQLLTIGASLHAQGQTPREETTDSSTRRTEAEDTGSRTPHLLFALSTIVATPGALAALEEAGQIPQEFLHRHVQGDWGELDPHDRQANERAVQGGDRIFSAYSTKQGARLWVITEHDRSVTTLLTPSEY